MSCYPIFLVKCGIIGHILVIWGIVSYKDYRLIPFDKLQRFGRAEIVYNAVIYTINLNYASK